MSSALSMPKRKRSALRIPNVLLHPGGWGSKRARPGSRSGSPTDSGASTPELVGSHNTPTYTHNPRAGAGGGSEQLASRLSSHEPQDNAIPVSRNSPQSPPAVVVGPPSAQSTSEGPWTGLEQALQALRITTK
ncbi:hypothetical protein FRC11_000796, partial [Ceratobasidium sp. 423]